MAQEKTPKERKWLPKKDAMRYLFISQRCIENYVNDGILKSYQLGGKVFFDQFELDEAIASSRLKIKKSAIENFKNKNK